VILLDEIGRAQRTSNGDPFGPLLEALDPSQGGFRDDYIGDIALDVSGVLFVLTTNELDGVPAPLIDRCDVITIRSYTAPERREILVRHLVPRALAELRLGTEQVVLTDGAIDVLAGVGDEKGQQGLRGADALLRSALEGGLREHLESCGPVSITRATVERWSRRLEPPIWWGKIANPNF
jgi:ATP-dependent Lon protease